MTECILVASDVAARGLDIPMVDHVVHYQVPKNSDVRDRRRQCAEWRVLIRDLQVYVHRSGRTARAEHKGESLMLIGPDDRASFLRLLAQLHKSTLPTMAAATCVRSPTSGPVITASNA